MVKVPCYAMSMESVKRFFSREDGKVGPIEAWLNRHFMFVVLTPSLLMLGLLVVLPLGYLIQTSFVETTFTGTTFVGLENYQEVFNDPKFARDLRHTVIYAIGTTFIAFVVGFAIALALNQIEHERLRTLLVTAVLLAWAVPTIVNALIWSFMLNSDYGVVNEILLQVGLISDPIAFVAEPFWAFVVLILADAWSRSPFATLIMLAGLQTIPQHLYEAATVDGASDFAKFRDITLPNVKSSASIAILIMGMFAFRTFSIAYGLTRGGPAGRTEVLAQLVFQSGIQELRLGYAAALSIIMILITLVFVSIYVKLVMERETSGTA